MTNIKHIDFRYKSGNNYLSFLNTPLISRFKPIRQGYKYNDSQIVTVKMQHCKGLFTPSFELLTQKNEAFLYHSFIPCQICTLL